MIRQQFFSQQLKISLPEAATVCTQIYMPRAYGSQWVGGDYPNGRNKFRPYNMKRTYGSGMQVP